MDDVPSTPTNGLDSQASIDRVPESPPVYTQEEVSINEETSQNLPKREEVTGCSSFPSVPLVNKGSDVVIDMEDDFLEEPKPDNDVGNQTKYNEGDFDVVDFPDDDDALLVSAADKALEESGREEQEQGIAPAGLDSILETSDAAPALASEVTLDPEVKAVDDARLEKIEKLKKFQPLEKIYPDVRISDHNTVAFAMKPNYSPGDPLEPHPSKVVSKWETKYVPMPFCDENVAAIRISLPTTAANSGTAENENENNPQITDSEQSSAPAQKQIRKIHVWSRITETLGRYPIWTVEDFASSIRRYCKVTGELKALSYCIEEVMIINERKVFFEKVMPFLTSLVLQTADIITCPLPFLRRNVNHNISLTQRQIACLLANAFFCTLPRRFKSEIDMPSINLRELFCEEDERVIKVKAEKIRCLINYFARIEADMPSGVVTYSRKNLRHSLMPDWGKVDKELTKFIPVIQGTIEDDGAGLLKVDFANSYIGGGALGRGAVQEEILFMIYPELILSRLFCEKLNSNEAIIVTGCERFSRYKGYSYNFKYDGDYYDSTPFDSRGRRCTQIVAIDALYISRPTFQYHPKHILREVNKAYVGFSSPAPQPVAVATGKWGCGAFNGDPHLKAIIQILAASNAGRDLVFFTFGDVECLKDVTSIYNSISPLKIKEVWNLLGQYHSLCCTSNKTSRTLKDFCKQYSEGKLWQLQQEQKNTTESAVKMKEVPITNFYAPEKRQSVPLDDESVAAIIDGIDQINSYSSSKNLNGEATIPPGKRQREDELTESQIAQELTKDDDVVPKENKSEGQQDNIRSQIDSKFEEENASSPKSSKRPKRLGLEDFYKDLK